MASLEVLMHSLYHEEASGMGLVYDRNTFLVDRDVADSKDLDHSNNQSKRPLLS